MDQWEGNIEATRDIAPIRSESGKDPGPGCEMKISHLRKQYKNVEALFTYISRRARSFSTIHGANIYSASCTAITKRVLGFPVSQFPMDSLMGVFTFSKVTHANTLDWLSHTFLSHQTTTDQLKNVLICVVKFDMF